MAKDKGKTIADAPDPTYPFIPSKRKKPTFDLEGLDLPEVELTIAGRTFRDAKKTTLAQDLYARRALKKANLDTFVQSINLQTYDLDEFAEEIILRAYDTGVLFTVLAGLLVEDGVPWTLEAAERNAKFFSEITDDEDKKKLFEPIAGVVLSFFINAVASLDSFEIASTPPASPESEAVASNESHGVDRNGVRVTTDGTSGRPSSGNSPVTIPLSLGES